MNTIAVTTSDTVIGVTVLDAPITLTAAVTVDTIDARLSIAVPDGVTCVGIDATSSTIELLSVGVPGAAGPQGPQGPSGSGGGSGGSTYFPSGW